MAEVEAIPEIAEVFEGAAKAGTEGGAEGGSTLSKTLDQVNQSQTTAGNLQQGMDLVSGIVSFVQQQEAIAAKAALDKSNDYDIKCAFISNTLSGIEGITKGKFNAMIVANTQSDNVNLNGIQAPSPYDPVNIAISNSATVVYRLWVFVDGSYTKNAGFGSSEWGWIGNATRADKKVKHGVHTDPVSTITFTKRS